MLFASHHRALSVSPCYGLPDLTRNSRNETGASEGLRRAFRGARPMRPENGPRAPVHREHAGTGRPPDDTAWPIALAIMLVANLAAPAAGMVPRREPRPAPDTPTFAPEALPDAHAPASSEFDDVVIQPLLQSPIKSDYTFHDFLKAVATARAPFHYMGESVSDAYEILSGQEIDPDVRRSIQIGTDALDLATSVLPNVGMLRLPGELADIALDELDGKIPGAEKIAGVLQYGDPRSLAPASRSQAASAGLPSVLGRAANSQPEPPVDASYSEPSPEIGDPVEPGAPDDGEDISAAGAGDAARSASPSAAGRAHDDAPESPLHIVDEHTHLRGYEQQLPEDQLPAEPPSRVVVVNGHYYLKGEAGYYRAQRGMSEDHWLIDAPHGSESRAQVPVTYDASTGKWFSHAPLRMCGGGCGSSHPLYQPDSIATSYEDIFRAVRHVPDEFAREAIQLSFSELSALRLHRSNRADLQFARDNSIVHHRTALREAMSKHIDPSASLIKQQRIASEITAMHYVWNEAAEAFCQENAEILFYALLQNGISAKKIRMITIHPQNRAPHVMVLYTDSKHFIELMERSTPQPAHPLRPDGISHEFFREAAYLTRDSTLLLDPWSRTKAISFVDVTNRFDAGRKINRALVDIGQTPGRPYTVSITRPLGIHQVNQRGSTSSGDSPGQSTLGASSRHTSSSSADTESHARPASAS